MSGMLARARAFLPEFIGRLTVRRESAPIDSVDSLSRFVSTRAAFIAQKTLYGYLKTRMGTRYPTLFEDDVFVASIDVAKLQVYAACLADLALYAVWRTREAAPGALPDAACRALALACFRRGLADNAGAPCAGTPNAGTPNAGTPNAGTLGSAAAAFAPAEAEFVRRLAFWSWDAGPQGAEIFSESPAALVRWAPIAPELKRLDQEIVENSIRFKWRELRRELDRRLVAGPVAAEAAGLR